MKITQINNKNKKAVDFINSLSSNIIFAIPDENSANHKAFKKVF